MPLATTNILPTAIMKEASDHAYSSGSFLSAGKDYVNWNLAGMGDTFKIPFFPATSPLFQADGNAATNSTYTPTARSIALRTSAGVVTKNPIYVLDQDAVIHGEYLAREVGKQIGMDTAAYFCNLVTLGAAKIAVDASQTTEITGAAGATATTANIQDAFWTLLEDARGQGISLSNSILVLKPRAASAIRQLTQVSSSDYSANADSTRQGYFDEYKGPGGLRIISPINTWFGTNKSADTNLPNDSAPVSARLDFTNYWGVLWDTSKMHVGVSEAFNISVGREDEKFHNIYTGRMIFGYNVSDTSAVRALMNASA